MKQGRAPTKMGPMKREPISRAVSPGAVSQIGAKVGEARAIKSLDAGRGYKAPAIRGGSHKSGSQGRH